jgi:hypothetical protein
MDSNNFPQNNLDNVHGSNYSGFNDYPNNLPPTTYNDNIPVHASNTPNNGVFISDHNYQQFVSSDTSTSQSYPQYIGQNSISQPYPQYVGQNPTSQPYPQYVGQDSTSQPYPQYIGQNPPQPPQSPINSLNITINAPIDTFRFGFKLFIMPITNPNTQSQPQQDQNHS